MFALGEKTVNQRKHDIVCKRVVLYMDKTVKVFYKRHYARSDWPRGVFA